MALVIALSWVGCGAPAESLPTLDEARPTITETIQKNAGGHLGLLSIEKSNAQRGEALGVPFYEIELTGSVKANADLYNHRGNLRYERQRGMSVMAGQKRRLVAGEVYRLEGYARFILKENGWDLDGVRLLIPEDE